jgi:hypothetical protein
LPKSRSIEIASGENELPSAIDAWATAKPKFRHWHHGGLNWLDAAASFLKRFYLNRTIRGWRDNAAVGWGAMTRDRNDVAGAGNSLILIMSPW